MTTSTGTKRLVVAINPSASFGKGREVGPAAVAALRGQGHDVVSLSEPDFPSLVAAPPLLHAKLIERTSRVDL